MKDGFIKVAVAGPQLRVADTAYNADELVRTAWAAASSGAKLLVTPELGITGYTCGDLFLQETLLNGALDALAAICEGTADLDLLFVVGLPLRHHGKLYNCAAVLFQGQVLGVVPKSHLPNYNEFYELRHFTPAFEGIQLINEGFMQGLPIGTSLLFRCEEMPALQLAVEICEDLWVPSPPSTRHALAGATVIANLSASDETIGKAEYRRALVAGQSARLVCGYLYADAGSGESSTDMAFAGHCLVAENGTLLAESPLFSGQMAISELDLGRLEHDRLRQSTFGAAQDEYMLVPFSYNESDDEIPEPTQLTRFVSPTPFIPADAGALENRCETILAIQAAGLKKRLEHTNARCAVIGISGGLDSTLALLVACRAFALLGRPMSDIVAISMPCFGTTQRTRTNAEKLCDALGVSFMTIDITGTVRSHFDEIGQSESDQDVVYENAQARIRTLVLMDVANKRGGLVVGTGDLSELALGWATYNGDHMSMYAVNASVPKTLIRYIVGYVAKQQAQLTGVLTDILDTPVSPELLPPTGEEISQKTEELVGPYELHDFYLYYFLRWGFSPAKILRLALYAFGEAYSRQAHLKWMRNFLTRFFSQQFKRSCLPDGPKVGSVSLSPRGDWRMPSDAVAALWLDELEKLEAEQ